MPPEVLPEHAQQRFNGNTCWYIFNARHQQRVFLARNVNTVLRKNEARRRQESGKELSQTPSAERTGSRTATRLGIEDTLSRLRPAIHTGPDEPILKIEARSLKRKRQFRPKNTSNSALSSQNGRRRPKSIRCRCELTIFENVDGKAGGPKTVRERFGYRDDTSPLFRSNEPCTVNFLSDDTATIEMDDAFFIKSSKLYVATRRGGKRSFCMAESYTAQLALQPIDPDCLWPPLLNDGSRDGRQWEDPFNINLITILSGLPFVARLPQPEVLLKIGETFERADLSLEMDCGWHKPSSVAGLLRNPEPRSFRLPTPISERDPDSERPVETVLSCFYFLSPVQDDKLRDSFGEPDMRGQHAFTVPGYTCPFCDGREFPNCRFLHFHFITAHALFEFKVKERKPTSGLRGGDQDAYDIFVEIFVGLHKESGANRASNDVPDHRTFRWVKPKKDFALAQILKGNWSWLNEKKGTVSQSRRATSQENPVPQGPRKIDLTNVMEIPSRKRKRYKVPNSRNGVDGLVFIRTKSKRFVHTGEELSESDDEVDEDWLKMKHDETIDDFSDVSKCEQTFMKLWDRHMFDERPVADIYIPHSLIRFSKANADYLRHSNILIEFWKHLINYVQYSIIDTECVRVCMEIVKVGDWSSVGKSKWGLGLVGPLPLDDRPGSPGPSNKPGEDSTSTPDEDEEMDEAPDLSELQVKQEDALSALRNEYSSKNGICKCDKGWDRPDMVYCTGVTCTKRWFHRSCFGVERWASDWMCPLCEAEGIREDR